MSNCGGAAFKSRNGMSGLGPSLDKEQIVPEKELPVISSKHVIDFALSHDHL